MEVSYKRSHLIIVTVCAGTVTAYSDTFMNLYVFLLSAATSVIAEASINKLRLSQSFDC
jgi:hypothetical protein